MMLQFPLHPTLTITPSLFSSFETGQGGFVSLLTVSIPCGIVEGRGWEEAYSFLICSSNHLHGMALKYEETYGGNCSSIVLRNECAPAQGDFYAALSTRKGISSPYGDIIRRIRQSFMVSSSSSAIIMPCNHSCFILH